MFSSVQAVLLYDVNCFSETCKTEKELEENVAQLKLASLKLLTEFGAKTENYDVRWSSQYYDSSSYKINKSRKSFIDFNRKSFEEFENGVTDSYCNAFDKNVGDDNGVDRGSRRDGKKSHSFILKKVLQEILLDYNWDRPDISSPVKKTGGRRRSKGSSNVLPENKGAHNAIIVFTDIPQSREAVIDFCGEVDLPESKKGSRSKISNSNPIGDDYLGSILDPATSKGFQEKHILLNLIAINPLKGICREGLGNDEYNIIHSGLGKLGGALHLIGNIVEKFASRQSRDESETLPDGIFPSTSIALESIRIQTPWWRRSKGSRPRRPQKGPTLIWEDKEGISHIRVDLEVLAVHGSSSRSWGNASVVAVMQSSSISLLAMACGTGHLYVCHAPNTVFTSLIQLLTKHQLSMLLKLSCGGVAVLSPWAGGVASLAVVSASGLATPPIAANQQNSKVIHPSILKFVTQSVEKCLKSAPAQSPCESKSSLKRFAAHQTERWFRPLRASESAIKRIVKKRSTRTERLAMQERLQKKYRPQIPQPLATGDIEKVDLVDITQPPADPDPGTSAKPNLSRARQLVKKSHIVTAQQKVKEQLAEEEERVQATERRAALASEQARKSQALESHVLNKVSDPKNTDELIHSLIQLRESSEVGTDSYTTAHTIINLALTHIRNSNDMPIVEDELRRILGDGVIQSASEINAAYPSEHRLCQYKFQTLLHLELLWLFGYSSSCMVDGEDQDSRGCNLREHHIGEAVKLLRAMSLTHNPTTMANFLQDTILDKYGDTLGEVLVELYEELNQPLPEALSMLSEDMDPAYHSRLLSVRSMGSNFGPGSNGSYDNPDSNRSREEKRLPKNSSVMEPNKHRLVVPMVTRAIKRTISEQPKQVPGSSSKESSETEIQKVRRNLFDLREGKPKSKLQRSHTIGAIPVTELRRSPRKKPAVLGTKSPLRRRGQKTPLKGTATSSRGLRTPKTKKGVFAPETPSNKVGLTIFNKKRICKSTGATVVTESPDVKKACGTTPRRLRASLTVSRRNSFYSGARSRNWERAKTQLLADHVRGKSTRRTGSLDNHDVSFLFMDILSDGQALQSHDDDEAHGREKPTQTPERKILHFGLDDESTECEDVHLPSKGQDSLHQDSPAKNLRHSSKTKLEKCVSLGPETMNTPLKKVRRALSLSTPSKMFLQHGESSHTKGNDHCDFDGRTIASRNRLASPDHSVRRSLGNLCPSTPKRSDKGYGDASMVEMTPSKRVQFSLTQTPGKDCSHLHTPRGKGKLSEVPGTPKSILKTPKKTPNKTPCKISFPSPDIFASSWKKSPRSPLTTPQKRHPRDSPFSGYSDSSVQVNHSSSPTKVDNIACFEESEMELVSPVKKSQGSSKASLIVHNTPKKKHLITSLLDSKCEEEQTLKVIENDNHFSENSVDLDGDASNVPYLNPADIDLLNNVLFVDDDLSSSQDGYIDFMSCKDLENSLKSPLKFSAEAYKNAIDESSLPTKQDDKIEWDSSMEVTPNRSHASTSEAIEVSPTDADKMPTPTLERILNVHLRSDESGVYNDMDEIVSLLSPEEDRIRETMCYLHGEEESPCESPEIPLDMAALSRGRNHAKTKDKILECPHEDSFGSDSVSQIKEDPEVNGSTSDKKVLTACEMDKKEKCKKKKKGNKKANHETESESSFIENMNEGMSDRQVENEKLSQASRNVEYPSDECSDRNVLVRQKINNSIDTNIRKRSVSTSNTEEKCPLSDSNVVKGKKVKSKKKKGNSKEANLETESESSFIGNMNEGISDRKVVSEKLSQASRNVEVPSDECSDSDVSVKQKINNSLHTKPADTNICKSVSTSNAEEKCPLSDSNVVKSKKEKSSKKKKKGNNKEANLETESESSFIENMNEGKADRQFESEKLSQASRNVEYASDECSDRDVLVRQKINDSVDTNIRKRSLSTSNTEEKCPLSDSNVVKGKKVKSKKKKGNNKEANLETESESSFIGNMNEGISDRKVASEKLSQTSRNVEYPSDECSDSDVLVRQKINNSLHTKPADTNIRKRSVSTSNAEEKCPLSDSNVVKSKKEKSSKKKKKGNNKEVNLETESESSFIENMNEEKADRKVESGKLSLASRNVEVPSDECSDSNVLVGQKINTSIDTKSSNANIRKRSVSTSNAEEKCPLSDSNMVKGNKRKSSKRNKKENYKDANHESCYMSDREKSFESPLHEDDKEKLADRQVKGKKLSQTHSEAEFPSDECSDRDVLVRQKIGSLGDTNVRKRSLSTSNAEETPKIGKKNKRRKRLSKEDNAIKEELKITEDMKEECNEDQRASSSWNKESKPLELLECQEASRNISEKIKSDSVVIQERQESVSPGEDITKSKYCRRKLSIDEKEINKVSNSISTGKGKGKRNIVKTKAALKEMTPIIPYAESNADVASIGDEMSVPEIDGVQVLDEGDDVENEVKKRFSSLRVRSHQKRKLSTSESSDSDQEVKRKKRKSERKPHSSESNPREESRHHRKRTQSSDSDQEELYKRRKRKSKRVVKDSKARAGRRLSKRSCKQKLLSLKEVSSDDENYQSTIIELESHERKKRIFDSDSDFRTPDKIVGRTKLEPLPLKNMENLPGSTRAHRISDTNMEDTDSQVVSESAEENSLMGTPKTPAKKEKQQKIDMYLSPIHKKQLAPITTPSNSEPSRKVRKRPQTPNDWKRIKPRRTIKKDIKDVKPIDLPISTSKEHEPSCDMNGKKKRKKKRVKLKLTKSGNNYEVSNVDVSLESSDRNSSGAADPQKFFMDVSAVKSSKISSSESLYSGKKKKSSNGTPIITPLRFTRHMSKDLSVSPELFSQLIALSPEKCSSPTNEEELVESVAKKDVCEIRKRKRVLLQQFNGKKIAKTQNAVSDSASDVPEERKEETMDSEWTVQSLPGSPTMKTFIRKQRRKFSISSSPRVEISPMSKDKSFKEPSLMSLLHLSVSPIINKVKTETPECHKKSKGCKIKSKAFRSLHRKRNASSD